jgi:phosphoribosyl 1,2-cyclic phosphate phosphodiesterase
MAHIAAKFGYTLRDPSDYWDLPVLSVHPVAQPFELFGLSVTPIPVIHGRIEIYGYRIGDMAYVTDVSEISSASIALLKGVKTLLLDCLRYTPHFTHINLEQSIDYASLIGAEQTFLIHMTHDMEYETLSRQLPKGVFPAFDGMKLAL